MASAPPTVLAPREASQGDRLIPTSSPNPVLTPPSRRFPPPSPNPVLLEAESQWLFSEEELLRTPSALDGMAPEKERENRGKGVNFITQVGIMLRLPQLTLASASVFLHRFFMRHSMVDTPERPGMHYYAIAATAIFLATKVEENCRKMRDLIIACCRVAQKNPNLVIDEQSKEYWRWRDTILHNEDILLEAICFDLSLEPPYKTLYDFLVFFGQEHNKKLRNAAWAFVNDSNLTMLCVLFPSRTIAAAAIYCAAKYCEVDFPDFDGRPWWDMMGVDLKDVRKACNYMASIYENVPMKHSENIYSRTPEDGDPLFARTRARGPETPETPCARPPPRERQGSVASVTGSEKSAGKRTHDASASAAGTDAQAPDRNGTGQRNGTGATTSTFEKTHHHTGEKRELESADHQGQREAKRAKTDHLDDRNTSRHVQSNGTTPSTAKEHPANKPSQPQAQPDSSKPQATAADSQRIQQADIPPDSKEDQLSEEGEVLEE
ncbi:cyclin-like protein [Xylona heveae TC161]|uniref:RNA polymerase II holoenzyme cyclin-like subunit n=1 Tax=Xylona heveae (strain CBS 132557 / TC161) TaxID=1328760 RepID=A0A164ZZR3_XYLHT|nr:cyclin-like protein [Xylona heveae TC161]KZF19750.1 cyclin-like protein [Xylona heveae TC161]